EAKTPPLTTYLNRLENVKDRVESYQKNLESAANESFEVGDIARQVNELEFILQLVEDVRKKAAKEAPQKLSLTTQDPNWLRTDEVVPYYSDIQAAVLRLNGYVHQSVRNNVEIDRANYRTAMGIVYSTSVLVVLLLFVLVWLGYRAVFHPIRALHRGVVKLAA